MPTGDSIGVRERFAADTLAVQTFTSEDVTADAVTDILRLNHRTTGTPAIGLAASLSFGLESSTTLDVLAADIEAAWTTVTHATRTSDLIFRSIVSGATTEFLRLDGSASAVVFATGIALTLAGDLAVNGGDLTSTATTFNLLNATVTTLNLGGAATTIAVGAAASATTWTGQSYSLTGANSTNNTTLTVQNTSNAAAASHAILDIRVGGITSTGDPQLRLTVPSGTSWYMGVDNNSGDHLTIGTGTAVGSSTWLVFDGATTGVATNFPLYCAGVNVTATNSASAGLRSFGIEPTTLTLPGTTTVTYISAQLYVTAMTIAQSGGAVTVNAAAGIIGIGATAGASVTLTHSSAFRALTGGAAVNVAGYYAEAQTAGTTGNYQMLLAVSTGAAPALIDHVGITARDFGVGDTRLYIASEAGSDIIIGSDTVRATWATQAVADATVDLGAVSGSIYSLVRITSSLQYKTILPNYRIPSKAIYALPLAGWTSRASDYGRLGYSPVAEWAYTAHPTFAQLGEDGNPVGINWYNLNTAVLAEVQTHESEIRTIRAQMEALASRLKVLETA